MVTDVAEELPTLKIEGTGYSETLYPSTKLHCFAQQVDLRGKRFRQILGM
jgi:hypothetical protein